MRQRAVFVRDFYWHYIYFRQTAQQKNINERSTIERWEYEEREREKSGLQCRELVTFKSMDRQGAAIPLLVVG